MRNESRQSLRVLMVDSEDTWRGGEAQLRLLMMGLVEQGVQVELAAPPGSEIERRTRDLGVSFHAVSIGGGMDVVSVWRLRSVIARQRFDVVHAHASHAHSVTFMACRAMSENTRPFQVVSRRVDFAVATNRLSRWKYRYGADLYLAISNGVRDVLVECGVPAEKIRLVPSGIDLSKFGHVRDNAYVKREFGIDETTPVVGNIAALAPHKSQVDLIRAARIVSNRYPRAKFLIVGEGDLRRRLERSIRDLRLEGTVILTGFREDPLEIMSTFTCFVLSSYLEGLGTSVMDAQAMGVPVVATRTGGVPDIVEDRETGLLVPPRDPDALAGAILRLLDDPEMRQCLAKKALEKSRGYDYRRTVYKTLDAYHELLANAGCTDTVTEGRE
jgi:glycosyltransferase involved in cell wall biosynthesis